MIDENELIKIRDAMIQSGVSKKLADDSLHFALKYEGLAHLMVMWNEETDDPDERKLIIGDIKDLVRDIKKFSNSKIKIRNFKDTIQQLSSEVRKEAFYLTLEMLQDLGELKPEDIVKISRDLGLFVDAKEESELTRSLKATARDLGLKHILDCFCEEEKEDILARMATVYDFIVLGPDGEEYPEVQEIRGNRMSELIDKYEALGYHKETPIPDRFRRPFKGKKDKGDDNG